MPHINEQSNLEYTLPRGMLPPKAIFFLKCVATSLMHGYNARLLQVGSVAQSVEQRTFNPLVPSSNLGRPTKNPYPGALAQLVEQRTLNP